MKTSSLKHVVSCSTASRDRITPFQRERPTKLMLHFVRTWAKDRGLRRLRLGGGVGGKEDSLYRFKAGFSTDRHAFEPCASCATKPLTRNSFASQSTRESSRLRRFLPAVSTTRVNVQHAYRCAGRCR